jgi:hypothetical protein
MTNKIFYKDFEPDVLEKKFWSGSVYESLEQVMEKVNEWVRKNYNQKIINVETVIIPRNHYSKKNQDHNSINMHGGNVLMIQVVRVWYQ